MLLITILLVTVIGAIPGGGAVGDGPPKLRRVGYSSLYPPPPKIVGTSPECHPPQLLTQNCATGYSTISYDAISFNAINYNVISYSIISYNIINCYCKSVIICNYTMRQSNTAALHVHSSFYLCIFE